MSWWNARGRARVSVKNAEAFGICDCCGFLYNLNQLRWQYAWQGAQLINQNLRHCPSCLDIPNEQGRQIVIPPDPVPVPNPRPELQSELTSGDFDADFNSDFSNG